MKRMRGLTAALFVLGALGCVSPTDPLGREDALEEAQKKYTELIRWGDVERAAQYVHPDERDGFLALAGSIQDLRITDFDIGEIEFGDMSATVTVLYRGYSVAEYVERSAREVQQWHREEGFENHWTVRPGLHDVVADLQGRSRTSRN